MERRSVRLVNRLGLHARAASKLVQKAAEFRCEVRLVRDDRCANAKSIMGVLMLAAPVGTELTLECEGDDERAAAAALTELIERRFGEAE
jgi:phosphocarrier protein